MHDPGAVRRDERLGELRADAHDVRRWQRIGTDVPERLPLDVFHDEEVAPVLLVEVVDGSDVRMIEARQRLGLAPEARARQFVGDAPVG